MAAYYWVYDSTSPAGWLPRTDISSVTLCSAIEYGLHLPFLSLSPHVSLNLLIEPKCSTSVVWSLFQVVTSSYTDLQDYTYYFVPAPWLSIKLLRLLQNYPPPGILAPQALLLGHPMRAPGRNVPLIQFLILALYILFTCLYRMPSHSSFYLHFFLTVLLPYLSFPLRIKGD